MRFGLSISQFRHRPKITFCTTGNKTKPLKENQSEPVMTRIRGVPLQTLARIWAKGVTDLWDRGTVIDRRAHFRLAKCWKLSFSPPHSLSLPLSLSPTLHATVERHHILKFALRDVTMRKLCCADRRGNMARTCETDVVFVLRTRWPVRLPSLPPQNVESARHVFPVTSPLRTMQNGGECSFFLRFSFVASLIALVQGRGCHSE